MSGACRPGRLLCAVAVSTCLGLVGVACAARSGHAIACDPSHTLNCTLNSLLQRSTHCKPAPADPRASTASDPRAGALLTLVEDVPCPTSGTVSYDTRDDHGDEMAVLDPIDNPAGGYLGVYHSAFGTSGHPSAADSTSASPVQGPARDTRNFRISLARSTDLIHWTRTEVLDSSGATMPTLEQIPGTTGYLLAYEKSERQQSRHFIRVRYYRSLDALLSDRVSAQVDLPRHLSRYNNGTPSFLSIRWGGSPRRSVLELGFHYEQSTGGPPGPDREALGTLRGFRQWSIRRDTTTDQLLDQQSFAGSHGDRREFSFKGGVWRLYEAQSNPLDFSAWHVVLYDPATNSDYPLVMNTARGQFGSSFGNPIARVLRAPNGNGEVLAVTIFVFSAGPAAGEPGELVYYKPM